MGREADVSCWGAREGGGKKGEGERGKREAVLFVACQQLLETSFPSMCESYLAWNAWTVPSAGRLEGGDRGTDPD